MKDALGSESVPPSISKFLLITVCYIFGLDLIIINNSVPISIYRPFEHAKDLFVSTPEMLQKFIKFKKPLVFVMSRFHPTRPLYYDQKYDDDTLEGLNSHFILWMPVNDDRNKLQLLPTPFNHDGDLAALQVFQSGAVKSTSFDSSEKVEKFFYSNGEKRESLTQRVMKKKQSEVWNCYALGDNGEYCCKLCTKKYESKTGLTNLKTHCEKVHGHNHEKKSEEETTQSGVLKADISGFKQGQLNIHAIPKVSASNFRVALVLGNALKEVRIFICLSI